MICTYSEERWELLMRAIASLKAQLYPVREIVVVVDHNAALLERVRGAAPEVLAIANDGPQGLSGCRNAGTVVAQGDIVASVDDDAVLARDWTLRVAENFLDPSIVAVGSAITPEWEDGVAPAWFPPEFYWVVGCTYRGVPSTRKEIRNPLGAAMALRRDVLRYAGGYRSELGRFNKRPLGCEETELCVRVRQQDPLALIIQEPLARASHYVPAERKTWQYFRARCFSEGLSKAAVSRTVGASDGLASERRYVTRTLPQGIWNGITSGLRGDPDGFARTGAIVAGLLWTTAGFAVGLLRSAGSTGKPAPAMPVS